MTEREIAAEGIERMYADDLCDAIDLASDQDQITWITKDGKRIAAIVPVDAAQWAQELLPAMHPCRRKREGCRGTGIWKPFYKGYVCTACLDADSADVKAHRNPPGDNGVGTLFQVDPDDPPLERQ